MHLQEISFSNGKQARLLHATQDTHPHHMVRALDITPPPAVIISIGGARNMPEDVKAHLFHLYKYGIVQAALQLDALIIDGGACTGIIELIGKVVASHHQSPVLIGVTPKETVVYPGLAGGPQDAQKISLDPNHSHFVLVEGDAWGSETQTMFTLAQELAPHGRVLTVLADGGAIALNEVSQTILYGWPLLVITGSGRLADEIAGLREDTTRPENEALRQIKEYKHLSFISLTASPQELMSRISLLLQS